MNRSFISFIALFFGMLPPLIAQDNTPIGHWRDHLPYQNAIAVTEGPDKYYCASESALFSYDKESKEVSRISTVQNISDIGVTDIRYNETSGSLVITYKNGNIDLIKSDNRVVNISSVKESNIIANKTINNIYFENELAYLSCGFGIVIVDTEKDEIKDSYIIGPSGQYVFVNDLIKNDTAIIAATDEGLYSVLLNSPNLADYNYWEKSTKLPPINYNHIASFNGNIILNEYNNTYNGDTLRYNDGSGWKTVSSQTGLDNKNLEVSDGKLYVCHNGSVHTLDKDFNVIDNIFTYKDVHVPEPRHAIKGSDGNLWVADYKNGLVKIINNWNLEINFPNGPEGANSFNLKSFDEKIYVAPGGLDGIYHNLFNKAEIYTFDRLNWVTIDRENYPELDSAYDIVSVSPDPANTTTLYAATMGAGLLEISNGKLKVYNDKNSTLESRPEYYWVGVSDIDFDNENRLWALNPQTTNCLSVRKKDGTWLSYDFQDYISTTTYLSDLMIDSYGRKWMLLPREGKILVFDDNRTIDDLSDDKVIMLTGQEGEGNIPGEKVISIAEDNDSEVWIGTNAGVAVFYNASSIFQEGKQDAEQIYITQDGVVQILLETEGITSISVDGANRKWFGTQSSGVFLMSENGLEEIFHFTEENSPLLSNTVTSTTIENKSGEVFFGTSKGIISYKSTATKGSIGYKQALVYPNPVRPDYKGMVAIKGLISNSDVRITDISGNTLHETTALGGQAVWDVTDKNGNRVKSGVYLVFLTDQQGTKQHVAKIMIMN